MKAIKARKAKLLRVYRLLIRKNQLKVLAWVKLAYVAENSIRKSLGFDSFGDNVCMGQSLNKVTD